MNWATKWMKCINRCFVQSSCQSDVNNWIKGRWEMDSQTLYIFCLVGQKWRWTKNASGPTETVWDDTQKRLPKSLFRSYCGSNTRAPMTVWVKGLDLLVGNTKNWTLSLMHAHFLFGWPKMTLDKKCIRPDGNSLRWHSKKIAKYII
jgi:hypothetical protein